MVQSERFVGFSVGETCNQSPKRGYFIMGRVWILKGSGSNYQDDTVGSGIGEGTRHYRKIMKKALLSLLPVKKNTK